MRLQALILGLIATANALHKDSTKTGAKNADKSSGKVTDSGKNETAVAVDELEDTIQPCGEGMSGLVDIPADSTDMDSGLKKLHGSISAKVLVLESGIEIVQEIDLLSAELPVSVLDDRCFSIAAESGDKMLCVKNQKERNEWINAVSSAILCKYGVASSIQEAAGEEVEAPKVVKKKPKAIKIHIPEELGMQINGHSVASIATNLKKKEARKMTTVNAEEPDLTKNVVPKLDLAKKNEKDRTPTLNTIMAIKEAQAENGELHYLSGPKFGYESNRMSVISPHIDAVFRAKNEQQRSAVKAAEEARLAGKSAEEAAAAAQAAAAASAESQGGFFSGLFGGNSAAPAAAAGGDNGGLKVTNGKNLRAKNN